MVLIMRATINSYENLTTWTATLDADCGMLVVSQVCNRTNDNMRCMVFPASRATLEARVASGVMMHNTCSYIVSSRVLKAMGQ